MTAVGRYRLAVVVVLVVSSACMEPRAEGRPSDSDAPAPLEAEVPDPAGGVSASAPAPERPPVGSGCIRGGSTREEVRQIMGEPDSVSFGAWLYGRSEINFGYGVVVDFSNDGGSLILC